MAIQNATIQHRRGADKDFDASKMLPGEFAVTTDGSRKVLAAFGPGDVKELASAEDIEETAKTAMKEIKDAGADQTNAVNSAGITQKSEIKQEGEKQIADLAAMGGSLEAFLEKYYALRRTGRLYQTKIWKFSANPTSAGEKTLDNAGLIFEPSTDTVEGRDDYVGIPMFDWVNVNYIRDTDGSPRPTAIEGMRSYQTSGSSDVGAMQMSFYWKWDTTNPEFDLVTISDSPHPELGLVPWSECVKADGTVLPWCIGSKYISGVASDGYLRSQPGLKPEKWQSHNNMITNYGKKGEGYHGAGAERNTFQIIFNIIKGATKNSQNLYAGCTSYNFQYEASVQRTEKLTYFPVTNAQAKNVLVGSCVSVGYGANSSGTLDKDRGNLSLHKYADNAKVLRIEDLDDNNKAVYLDIEEGFDTTPVALTEELLSPVIISSMHWMSGETDRVIGKHDGSPISNTDARHPYRVQGREYAVGGYIIASDAVMDFQSDYSKNVYVAPKGAIHSSSDATIRGTYKLIGSIPASADGKGNDYWIGDISVDHDTGCWHPSAQGNSNAQGFGDMLYSGGTSISGTREYLQGGNLWHGSAAGSACLDCGVGLDWTYWNFLACD